MLPDNVNRDLPPLTVWQVESLRVTAFPSPAAQIEGSTWWAEVAEGEPDTNISHPKRGEAQFEGRAHIGKLILQIQPLRIQWVLSATDEQRGADSPPTIGSFPEVATAFLPLMDRWFQLDTFPLIQRLAFGAVLLQPVEERRTGYRQIAPYLHRWLRLDPDNSSDLLYQINRPRPSTLEIPQLAINRLSKWGVAVYRHFAAPLEPAAPTTYLFPTEELFTCLLEIDMNTSQHFPRELEQEQIPEILRELVNLGMEIAQEGDIP
jgi:hypothetical protein